METDLLCLIEYVKNLTERLLKEKSGFGRQRRGKGILGRKDRPCRERRWMESCWNSGCSIVGVTGVEPGDAKTSMFLVLHPWGAALGLAQMNGSIKTSG